LVPAPIDVIATRLWAMRVGEVAGADGLIGGLGMAAAVLEACRKGSVEVSMAEGDMIQTWRGLGEVLSTVWLSEVDMN
jgi:hypothetical protein